MKRHLMTMALGGLLGVCLMAEDAAACHKSRCGGCGGQAACYQPAAYSNCGRAKHCGGGGGGCHKKRRTTCAAPVMACGYGGYGYGGGYGGAYGGGYAHGGGYNYAAPVASGQYMGGAHATGQTMMTPHAPGKAMGAPQR